MESSESRVPSPESHVIYPTVRAIVLTAAGAPAALALALYRPDLWPAALAWIVFAAGLTLVDALLGADRTRLQIVLDAPVVLSVSRTARVTALLSFTPGRPPRRIEAALETNARLRPEPDRLTVSNDEPVRFTLHPLRRGTGELQRLHLRWTGPLGLAFKQRAVALDRTFPIDRKSVV